MINYGKNVVMTEFLPKSVSNVHAFNSAFEKKALHYFNVIKCR